MNQVKSSNVKANSGIVRAMRPIWRVGIPATAALSTVLAVVFAVALDGCSSNKNNKTDVTSSNHTSVSGSSQGTGVSTLPDLSSRPTTTAKKSKPVVQRLSTVGYADAIYGISFRYPRSYTLVTPDKIRLDQSLEQIPMNFVQPGGVAVATIGLPGSPVNSFFKINVNKNLTAQQCGQFADPDASDVSSNSPVDTNDDWIPTKVSLRGLDFMRVENGTEQNDLRYYHHFENGACYEFAMAVEESQGNAKPVDHFELFDQMERIMASVKIKSEPVLPVTANVPSTPIRGSNPQ